MMSGIKDIATMSRELRSRLGAASVKMECGVAGKFDSTIAVVGEAPTDRDCRVNQPFIGASGQVLFDALKKCNLSRNHVYMTYAIKRQVISASQAKLQGIKTPVVSKQEFDTYKNVLLTEISYLPNCKYILALGSYAIKILTGNDSVMHWRGSVIDVSIAGRDYKVICGYNPTLVALDPKLEIVFRMDMNKLSRILEGKFQLANIYAEINPSFKDAMSYIADVRYSSRPFAYDIETMGNETACVGLAISENHGMCINFRTQGTNRFSTREELVIRRALQTLFSTPEGKSVAQNANFDNYWLWYKDRIQVSQTWFDTMLAHHLLYPPLPHSLGFIVSQYTDDPYYKDEGKLWKAEGEIDDFWRYNVKDCCYTLIAQRRMLVELEEQDLSKFFFDHVMKLQPHLTRMTVGGLLCDTQLKETITDELTRTVGEAKELCQVAAQKATGRADYAFNPASPKQCGKLFFEDLKLVGRGNSTNKENRERMYKHSRTNSDSRAVITNIDSYLRDAKFLSTYASATIDPDDRFRCEYKQTGVINAPGRLSSSAVMWGSGLNLQNIPERAKPMFIADEGYEFSYFDAAQIEARFVAMLANIPQWKAQFEMARVNPGSYDAHCALASVMWNIPYENVPKEDFVVDPVTGLSSHTLRFTAKRCRHGLNYRMAYDRLATTANLSMNDAQIAYNLYHRTTPEIKDWWRTTIERAKRDRKITTPFGRRWILMERWDEDALDSIIAFVPQSMAGDHIASVIYKCERDVRWPRDARIVLNIHDALIAINRPADGPLVRALMRSYAEEPIDFGDDSIIVPADFKVSKPGEDGIHRWSTLGKLKERPELLSVT